MGRDCARALAWKRDEWLARSNGRARGRVLAARTRARVASSEGCDARRHTARPPEGRLTSSSDDKGRGERERETGEMVRRDEHEPLPKSRSPELSSLTRAPHVRAISSQRSRTYGL